VSILKMHLLVFVAALVVELQQIMPIVTVTVTWKLLQILLVSIFVVLYVT